jgi:hypothetical protein
MLRYMKLLNAPVVLWLNFREIVLVDGISTLVLLGANDVRTEGNEGNEERDMSEMRSNAAARVRVSRVT